MMLGTPPAAEGAPHSRFSRRLALLLALDAALVLSVLPRITLWNIDEGRISEVSREMALTGDFVTPRLGEIPFACYPPLPYWLMAASGSLFGWNEFAMRLPGAIAGLGLVAVLGLMTRRLAGEKAGLAAAMILATLPGFFMQEKMCRADVLTMFLATFAFDRFLAWAESPEERRRARDLALMYVAVALGVLAKGPIAIAMLGVGGLAWFIVRKRWKLLAKMGFGWGLPLAAAIILPWYLLVYRSAGASFLRVNLLDENIRAFTDGFEQKRPWHFYFRIAPPVMLPWILALGLVWRVRRAPGLDLALAWLAGGFLFLTLSSAKRVSYVAYLQPALAMAAGITLAALWAEAPEFARRGLWAVSALLAAGAGILVLARRHAWEAERVQQIQDLVPLLAALMAGGAVALAGVAWRGGPVPGTVALAGLVAGGLLVSATVLESRWEYDGRDGRSFCRRAAAAVPPGTRIAVLDNAQLDGAFHFYVGYPLPARGGGPGYYIVADWQREELLEKGRKLRELDSVKDWRKRDLYLVQVTE